ENIISDRAYLEMIKAVLAEREAMFFDTLEQNDSDLVVTVFVQTDRVSHMFYRGIDKEHPMYGDTGPEARGAIEWIYREADRILGKTMDELGPHDPLIVLSDHGFNPFRRTVHLNRWLVDHAYMTLKPGAPPSESLFTNVDWTKTRAYAIGLNGIYLNLAGRERLGIVRHDEAQALENELIAGLLELTDEKTGANVIDHVYAADAIYKGSETDDAPDLVIGYGRGYRASWQTTLGGVPEALIEDNRERWSGDHCVDPPLVPGVLFTSFPLESGVASIADVPALIVGGFDSTKGDTDAAHP
ncbi:MAG TPA: alkaline phosphatase family protein, partial [Woeseiaceae bacterium]|nr:alkaline phosphatase family protein [Woeseiaceae bacterium]